MTIACRLCGRSFKGREGQASPQGEPLTVQGAVLCQMSHHMASHPKQAVKLKGLIDAAATYMLITLYVDVNKDETEFIKSFEANEDLLIELFGFSPAPEDVIP